MDNIDDTALEQALAQACAAATSKDFQHVATVASALRATVRTDDDPLGALIAGLEYHLVLDEERRAPHGPFGPMMEAGGISYPAPLDTIDEITPGVYALWERAVRLAPLALVRARFADLLWEARYGDCPHEFAQVAVDEYIDASAGGFGHPIQWCDAVRRAVEIASQLNDQLRREHAIAAAVDLTRLAIESEERMPGVALPLLELFVNDRRDRRPPELEQLLAEATELFGNDPWNLESALELQARLTPPEERDALHRRAIEGFRDLASRSTGLVKYAHLQHAIELAEDSGLRSLADSIRHEIEGISDEELDLKEISVEVSVQGEDVDTFISWFVGDDDLESALARFGSHVPAGSPDENRKYVEQLMSDHPLQFLFTKITIGPENSLIRLTQGQDDQAEQAMIEHEAQRSSVFSLFAVDILWRIKERYGPIARATGWFETELIEPTIASKIGRAIELYETGDSDSAAAVIAPRLERIVRRLATGVGITVTRSPDRRGRSGGVKGLGELLGLLEGALHEPTRRYLRVLLSEVTGLNLRNRIGHGLDDETSQREAALPIHCACHLRLLARDERPGTGAE